MTATVISAVNWIVTYKRIREETGHDPCGAEFSDELRKEMIKNLEYQVKCLQDGKFTLLADGMIRIDT